MEMEYNELVKRLRLISLITFIITSIDYTIHTSLFVFKDMIGRSVFVTIVIFLMCIILISMKEQLDGGF